MLRSVCLFTVVAVPFSIGATYLMNDENSASFDAIILAFLSYVVSSIGAFLTLPDGLIHGLVSFMCAVIGGVIGFALNVDTDNDLDIDREELTSAAKQLTKQLDLDGDGSVEIAELSFILFCGCLALGISTLLRELARCHLQKQFFSEIKQLSGGWPEGFQTSSLADDGELPVPDETCNVFRRSHATGKWAVHMPEIDSWGTKKPYPLSKMVKWFKDVVNDKRNASPPDKWNKTPSQWLHQVHERDKCKESCVFCVGNEDKIVDHGIVYVEPSMVKKLNGWTLRVILNSKPLVKSYDQINENESKENTNSNKITIKVLTTNAGVQVTSIGRHELVIETNDHSKTLALMSDERVVDVVRVWKERGCALLQNYPKHTKYIHVYKNHGQFAGGSQAHAHSQIVSLGMVPNEMAHYVSLAKIYCEENNGKCVLCQDTNDALVGNRRFVESSKYFHVLTPFVQESCFHLWIVPKVCPTDTQDYSGDAHNSSFFSLNEEMLQDFAHILRRTLKRLYCLLGDPDYNLMVRSLLPVSQDGIQQFHWFVEIIPRIYVRDGFQLGIGCTKLSVTPEASAEAYRGVQESELQHSITN